ncbi:MAG: molybdopterin-dependent oxidoreductase [candidate division Zixibacteria bacterium]|nr:molybdopterin-dependent oxidoreductase [candidate division Zixibacteria bacterium]
MSKSFETITVTIDNQTLEVAKGSTILEAAEKSNVYIPTLCAHKDLSPFGGCRMCIVEVEGMRGFPTSCTTPAENGMVIRTQTAQIQTIRTEILNLILSEHPCSCLICDEKVECQEFSSTIRKVGVTTGCRYCPNDRQCELQDVAEKIGITEMKYPVYYRNLRVEKDDPFYDRDYNLCILCGRCVRMCHEIRTANAISFKERGRHTIIGPAFSRTHLEAGCEFCGACVSICPTGALSEKTRKWKGKAERTETTTCPLCGIGCQIELQIKGNEVIGSLPAEDPLINDGQLCVKGRFCINELVNDYRRLKKPYQLQGDTKAEISVEAAVALAAEKLSACLPEQFAMMVSPNCTNEDLYVAQKFVRAALGSHHIDTTARLHYGAGFNAYLNLMKLSVPLSDIRKASVILCIGLDTKFGRSVAGVELRKATRRGARIISINPRDHNFAVISERWLKPAIGKERELFDALVKLTGKEGSMAPVAEDISGIPAVELKNVTAILHEAANPVILVGSEFIKYHDSRQILEAIGSLAQNINAGVIPLPSQNNLFGSLTMGTYPELLPGGFSSSNKEKLAELNDKWAANIPNYAPGWNAEALLTEKKLKVLYLIGEVPLSERPPADFMIFQNIYPPPDAYRADLVLPAASFAEVDGTFTNGEGRVQQVRKAVDPPGEALADWQWLVMIARKMDKFGFAYAGVAEIQKEIAAVVKGFREADLFDRRPEALASEGMLAESLSISSAEIGSVKEYPYLLHTYAEENNYRGFPLSNWVDGLKKLFVDGVVQLNPEDADRAGIALDDEVVVSSERFERIWKADIRAEQPPGTMSVILRQDEVIGTNPFAVRMRKKYV